MKTKTNKGEHKRKEMSKLVRRALGKRNILKFRNLDWDTQLFDGKLSCGYLILRKDGNVMSFYTPTNEQGHENFPKFNAVELSLWQEEYERLAYKIGAELSRNGYLVGMTKQYTSRVDSFEIYRD